MVSEDEAGFVGGSEELDGFNVAGSEPLGSEEGTPGGTVLGVKLSTVSVGGGGSVDGGEVCPEGSVTVVSAPVVGDFGNSVVAAALEPAVGVVTVSTEGSSSRSGCVVWVLLAGAVTPAEVGVS